MNSEHTTHPASLRRLFSATSAHPLDPPAPPPAPRLASPLTKSRSLHIKLIAARRNSGLHRPGPRQRVAPATGQSPVEALVPSRASSRLRVGSDEVQGARSQGFRARGRLDAAARANSEVAARAPTACSACGDRFVNLHRCEFTSQLCAAGVLILCFEARRSIR